MEKTELGKADLGLKRPSISVVLPAYNEEASIEDAVNSCVQTLARFTDQPEVLIVNDGSTDGTRALADQLARANPAVRVMHNPINLGVGVSLQIGMRAAVGDLVVHDAMDYPFDLNDLDKVLPLFDEYDVVIVVRTDRSAHSPYRKLTSTVHYLMVKALFGVPFHDMNFVQVYRREVLQAIKVKGKSPAFTTPELLIRARDAGFKIGEVRAPFHQRRKGKAHHGKPRDILWTLADMLSFRLDRFKKAG